ncbi:uncharacterized protein EI97DRAFT_241311 [Westerdykella ornata]|uniref:Uncharacterized protein n=1 Tax=Westerdykella ornata TaxID=318751 RepID=A0A6A6J5Z1_WESOR|nr:uncharacterized protein EI97DRAFT_241311 [Westerdykella ornata]KAF2271855.1 hypothetical protein EI97DRAFT_241311 [Westerdykella ornata]
MAVVADGSVEGRSRPRGFMSGSGLCKEISMLYVSDTYRGCTCASLYDRYIEAVLDLFELIFYYSLRLCMYGTSAPVWSLSASSRSTPFYNTIQYLPGSKNRFSAAFVWCGKDVNSGVRIRGIISHPLESQASTNARRTEQITVTRRRSRGDPLPRYRPQALSCLGVSEGMLWERSSFHERVILFGDVIGIRRELLLLLSFLCFHLHDKLGQTNSHR